MYKYISEGRCVPVKCMMVQLTLTDWENGLGQSKDCRQYHEHPDIHRKRSIISTPGNSKTCKSFVATYINTTPHHLMKGKVYRDYM